MKLESQVVSLELSKKLKDLGVKQHSLFKWNFKFDEKGKAVYTELIYFPIDAIEKDIAAFTVAELGEMLPRGLLSSKGMKNLYVVYQNNNSWVEHWNHRGLDLDFRDLYSITQSHTEADARAKMLIYLIENNLITL